MMARSSTQNRSGGAGSLPELERRGLYKHTHGQNHERKKQFRPRADGKYLWIQLSIFLILSVCGRGHALSTEYCSNVNTGSSYSAVTALFQSNGLCYDNCKADYAFAIVQGSRCWCSDYIPASTTTGCDEGCPGYDQESCGNTKKGLFGYIALPKTPKGTAGSSSTVREPDSPNHSTLNFSPPHSPSVSTVIAEKPGPTTTVVITTSQTSSSTTESRTSTSSTSTTTSSSTTETTSTPSVSIVTSLGGYKTVTLAPPPLRTPTPTQQATNSSSPDKNFFSKPGQVAGTFVGLALGIILILAGLLFCYRRNKQRAARNSVGSSGSAIISSGGAGVIGGQRRSRSMSTLGLIGEKGGAAMNTTASTANNFSRLPAAEAGKSITSAQAPGRLIDQRLDPNQIYLRYDPDTGSSRMSVRSLRDDTDYSRRVLRLANPDD